ncbi:MAG TPA: hypothetical protein VFU97_24405 [Xanthobacteraceae bacterium]|nr:hypothetical protein [Xanthobacteraceae bacterium]
MSNLTGWNQARKGNATVFDGSERFWKEFPAGTTAEAVLADYLNTADYDYATKDFVIEAEIDGQIARKTYRV